MSKVHLSIKTTFGRPKGGRIKQVSLRMRNKRAATITLSSELVRRLFEGGY